MNRRDYESMTEKQFRGRQARTLFDMQNGTRTIAAGTVVTITRKFGGFDITVATCKHCGLGLRMTRVQPRDLELLPTSEQVKKGAKR